MSNLTADQQREQGRKKVGTYFGSDEPTKVMGTYGMINQEDERKIAENCGLEYWGKDEEGKQMFKGTWEQIQEFKNHCGMLEEQRENEADLIRENQHKND